MKTKTKAQATAALNKTYSATVRGKDVNIYTVRKGRIFLLASLKTIRPWLGSNSRMDAQYTLACHLFKGEFPAGYNWSALDVTIL
jgi:hypothetical protein